MSAAVWSRHETKPAHCNRRLNRGQRGHDRLGHRVVIGEPVVKLSIALAAAAVVLRFTTPGPGSYAVYGTTDYHDASVIASNHVTNACHVSVRLKAADSHTIYWISFTPNK